MSYRDEHTAALARCNSLEQELVEVKQALVKAKGPGWWARFRAWWGNTWFERLWMKDGVCQLCHGNPIFGEVPCECGTQRFAKDRDDPRPNPPQTLTRLICPRCETRTLKVPENTCLFCEFVVTEPTLVRDGVGNAWVLEPGKKDPVVSILPPSHPDRQNH